jgi:DNA-binding transcriptional MerR regulator
MRLLSIGEAAAELGLAVGTPRRLHRQGLLLPVTRVNQSPRALCPRAPSSAR